MRRVSIEDIAQRANVSHSTVSRALRGNPRISPSVRTRILALAHEMGYVPNAIAQSLQQRHSNTIGVVVTDVADPFWGEVVKGIEAVMGEAHKALFLSASQHDADRQLAVIEQFQQRRVDGIIIADSQLGPTHLSRVVELAVPAVFLNSQRISHANEFRMVTIDNTHGGQLAATHLAGLGHRRLAYLGAHKRPASNQQRHDGYVNTLRHHGVVDTDIVVVHGDAHIDDLTLGYALMHEVWHAHQPTAVFCYNDMLALGALSFCQQHQIAVPADVSIVGFDDVPLARFSWPALTTVAQPKVHLGRQAAHILLDRMAGNATTDSILTPSMVVRSSTAAPKGVV